MTAGPKTVVVEYSGDGNYTGFTNTTTWHISKLDNYTITETSKNITEGENEIIDIKL